MTKSTKGVLFLIVIGVGLSFYFFGSIMSKSFQFPTSIPNQITFKNLEGISINPAEFSSGKHLFIFFHSECDICERKGELFKRKTQEINDFNVVWISNENREEVQGFAKTYNLLDSEKHLFLLDTEGYSFTEFQVPGTPILLFYNNGELVKHFKNDAPVGYVVDQINEHL